MESALLVSAASLLSAILTSVASGLLYLLKERKSDKENRDNKVDKKLDGFDKRIGELEKKAAVIDERTKDQGSSVSIPIADLLMNTDFRRK